MIDQIVYSNDKGYVVKTKIGKNYYYVVYQHEATAAKEIMIAGKRFYDRAIDRCKALMD